MSVRERLWLGVSRPVAAGIGVFAAASIPVSLAIWGARPVSLTDTPPYQGLAVQLSHGHLDRLPYRALGYPFVLWWTGSRHGLTVALLVVQFLFHLAAVWMLMALVRRFRLPTAASLGLVALLFSPPLMEKVWTGLTEATCEVLVVATALLLTRWFEAARPWDAVGAGVAIGLAALVRPTYQLFGVLVALVVLVWLWRKGEPRRGMRSAALLVVGPVVILGWLTVVNAGYGYPGPSPMLGWNLTTQTAPFIEHLPDDEPLKPVLLDARAEWLSHDPLSRGRGYVWPVVDELTEASGMSRAEISQHLVWMNLRLIANRPIDYAASVGEAAGRYPLPSLAVQDRLLSNLYLLAHFAILGAFVAQAVGMAGLWLARHLAPPAAEGERPAFVPWAVAMSLIAYTAAVSVTADVGYPRFRTPTDGLILLVVFGGLATIGRAWRARPRGSAAGVDATPPAA